MQKVHMVMQCLKFSQKADLTRYVLFDLDKYTSNSSKGCVLQLDLE